MPPINLPTSFNTQPATIMHVDLNSCFAAIEQQANPKLRGVPTVVAAYPSSGGCILAASREAKEIGIRTGSRVGEARRISPNLAILIPDPSKYRFVHRQMMAIFKSYTPEVEPKSIDEAVLIFSDRNPQSYLDNRSNLFFIGKEIKKKIKSEIGEWLTVSVGLAPNRFLAKTAASLKKPDGLDEINYRNIETQFQRLELEDLCGINRALKSRLNYVGIFTTLEFLKADLLTLKSAFKSTLAYHWYLRLRGFETDDWRSDRRSIGHSYALPESTLDLKILSPILYRLCEKVGRRLRNNDYEAGGVRLSVVFKNWSCLSRHRKLSQPIFASADIYRQALKILIEILYEIKGNPVRNISASVFNLSKSLYRQQPLFTEQQKQRSLSRALDEINNRYGEFAVTAAPLIELRKKILDRIAFGGIRDI